MTTGGYDLILELNAASLTRLLKHHWASMASLLGARDDIPVTLPLDVWIADEQLDDMADTYDSVHFIISDLAVDILANSKVALFVHYERGSVALADGTLTEVNLNGRLRLEMPLRLKAQGAQRLLQLDLPAAAVQIKDEGQMGSLLRAGLQKVLLDRLASATPVPLLTVTVGDSGSLEPLTFTHLKVQTNYEQQTLFLLGNLLPDRQGNPDQVTPGQIPAGSDFQLQLSKEALHRLVVCPRFAEALDTLSDESIATADMPPACGQSDLAITMDDQEVILHELKTLLDDDAEGLTLRARASAPLSNRYIRKISSTISISVAPFLEDNALRLQVLDVSVEPRIHLTHLGKFARPLIGSVLSALTNPLFREHSLFTLAETSLREGLNAKLSQFALALTNSLAGFDLAYDDLAVAADGLLLSGHFIDLDEPAEGLHLVLLESGWEETDSTSETTVYATPEEAKICDDIKDEYELVSTYTEGTYTVWVSDFRLLGRPHSYSWRLAPTGANYLSGGDQNGVPLSGQQGTVQLETGRFQAPGTAVVDLLYTVDGDTITLDTDSDDGNYTVDVVLEITDISGQTERVWLPLFIIGYSESGEEEFVNDYRLCRFLNSKHRFPKALAIANMRAELARLDPSWIRDPLDVEAWTSKIDPAGRPGWPLDADPLADRVARDLAAGEPLPADSRLILTASGEGPAGYLVTRKEDGSTQSFGLSPAAVRLLIDADLVEPHEQWDASSQPARLAGLPRSLRTP